MNEKTKDYVNHRDRLKQKYANFGQTALHDYEILELLLFYAIPRRDVKPMAKQLLRTFGSIKRIMDAELEELKKINGMGDHSAILLKLVKDLNALYLKEKASQKIQINCTDELMDYCKMAFGGLKDERFCVIYLNSQNMLLDMETIQEGIVNQAVVYPRKVLERALKSKATAIILVHNHPSGHVRPSDADIKLTKLIQDTAKIMDILVHDHIIIGENIIFSFREEGILF